MVPLLAHTAAHGRIRSDAERRGTTQWPEKRRSIGGGFKAETGARRQMGSTCFVPLCNAFGGKGDGGAAVQTLCRGPQFGLML